MTLHVEAPFGYDGFRRRSSEGTSGVPKWTFLRSILLYPGRQMAFNPLALLRTVSRFGLVAASIGSAAALGAGALLHDAAPASAAGCTVSADEAAFFADAGYGGACLTVGYGNYDAPYIYPTIGNDTMTSLQVGGNARTIVYMHNAYPGANQGTTGSF